MAWAGRSSRSGGGRRLLVVALVVTMLVVLLDASLKSRSPAPAQVLSAQTWIDRVLPVIGDSTARGRQLDAVRTAGLRMPAASVRSQLQQVASSAAADERAVAALRSPVAAGAAPGLLRAALAVRARASASMARAVTSVLAGAPPALVSDPSVQAMVAAGSDLAVADRAYALFSASLPPSLGVSAPPSAWLSGTGLYDPLPVQTFLVALRNATNLLPVHQLAVQAVTTTPPPVGAVASVQQVPPTPTLTVTAVVADTGNQPESDLTVTATLTPATAGTGGIVRATASLLPGTSSAVTLGPLVPIPGTPATLSVTVAGPPGSVTPPATTTLVIEVAPPPPPPTTTTSPTTSVG